MTIYDKSNYYILDYFGKYVRERAKNHNITHGIDNCVIFFIEKIIIVIILKIKKTVIFCDAFVSMRSSSFLTPS